MAYLPQNRVRSLARGEPLPRATSGAALFADISGFTPLTEALTAALGPHRGVETLTDQLNAVYDALIVQVDQYHGSVVGFAGDAITCWFDDTDGPAAPRAAACALAMQAVMASFAAIALPGGATTVLSIKVAVASGPARRFVVGVPTVQRIDVLAGAPIARLAIGEHLAAKGEVVIDEFTAATLGNRAVVTTWHADAESAVRFAVLTGLSAAPPPSPGRASGSPTCPRISFSHGSYRRW